MEQKVLNLGIIASGGGTTAEVIMRGCLEGEIKDVYLSALISTETGAECAEKAKSLGIWEAVLDFETFGEEGLNDRLKTIAKIRELDFLITAGCKRRIFSPRIIINNLVRQLRIWNTHPAYKKRHGGRRMHGVAVHIHVLREILDQVWREMIKIGDPITTTVCFHEILGDLYDTGPDLLRVNVPIPWTIIRALLKGKSIGKFMPELLAGEHLDELEAAAKKLQQHVLQFEYRMLPSAVNIAAHIVRLENGGMR